MVPELTARITDLITQYRNKNINNHSSRLPFAVLKLAVNPANDSLKNIYKNHVESHNNAILTDVFPNSGFDLFVPEQVRFETPFKNQFVDHQVKAEMLLFNPVTDDIENVAYALYTRSSISKTPLMLSNHVGIIDQGYRGNLIGALRTTTPEFLLDANIRILQVCHPSLCPILVLLVDEDELSTTERNVGGFGSTGR
jgi:dUTP pyrophosphatase